MIKKLLEKYFGWYKQINETVKDLGERVSRLEEKVNSILAEDRVLTEIQSENSPAITSYTERTKPLKELTGNDIPPGLDPCDVATDFEEETVVDSHILHRGYEILTTERDNFAKEIDERYPPAERKKCVAFMKKGKLRLPKALLDYIKSNPFKDY